MTTEEKERFANVLSKNTIEYLRLYKCSFTEELCDVLTTAFPQMSTLQELSIEWPSIADDAAFRHLRSIARDLPFTVVYH